MESSRVENFREDGKIICLSVNQYLLYDFEKRDRYYDSCGFRFKDFGQFERKIQKPEIALSIQCSKDEKCFCIAWHEDFKKEEIKYIGSATASGKKEYTGKRFTKAFREMNYNEMNIFYHILLKAFTTKKLNASCFQL